MDVLGIVISLLKGMFQPLLGTHFGHSFVISRCLCLCLLVKWIEKSKGLAKDLCFNCSDFIVTLLFECEYLILFDCKKRSGDSKPAENRCATGSN
ncbi:hypothetical protein Lal_00038320 [Lupinus albus]|nr:hypothetical protein Lal_00038320 [Lupinus albus]